MWFHHNLTSSPVSLLSWQLGFHERGLVFTSQKKLITKPQVKYHYSPYHCRLPNSPIISLITRNHQISGTVSSSPSDVANLSFQSCLTVALTSLLSFARLLPLLFSFIQSPLMSHPDNRDTIPHSPCLQTFFPRIHLPYHLLITLSSLFPYTNCKSALRALAFPSLVAGCASTSISYAPTLTGLHPASGAGPVIFSYLCSHCTSFSEFPLLFNLF